MRIAVDAMGGDHAPNRPVAGALAAQGEHARDFEIVLVGDESRLTPLVSRPSDRLSVQHAPEAIGMDEPRASVTATRAHPSAVAPPAVAAERGDR